VEATGQIIDNHKIATTEKKGMFSVEIFLS